MHIDDLAKEHKIIKNFIDLTKIPSPSRHEEKVIEFIKNYCADKNLNCVTDDYSNIIIKLEGTDKSKRKIGISAHMDVVGDDSPINHILVEDYFIKAEGRTLGADDKAGVAAALTLLDELSNSNKPHGDIEVIFTRDEESGMSGIENFDFNNLSVQYILVCDADKLAQLQISGASYTNLKLKVHAFKGGHSGIDIADKTRPNAAKLIAEICNSIPQGVYYFDETGVITSINLGGICGGNVNVTNVLNTDGEATYSIRSASKDKENDLCNKIKSIIDDFNKKYENIAEATAEFSQHLPAFEKSDDTYIQEIFKKVATEMQLEHEVSSFHAGAETHIYCQNKNKNGETFIPFLLGLADIYNMHSADEKVDYRSLIKGYELLKNMVLAL